MTKKIFPVNDAWEQESKKTRETTFEQFAKDAEGYQSQLHKHWPYTDVTWYEGGLYGDVDLLNPEKRFFRHKNDKQIRTEILGEVSRAMCYTSIHSPDFSAGQRLEAFSMARLLTGGLSIWQKGKDIPKNWIKTSREDGAKYYEFCKKRGCNGWNTQTKEKFIADHARHIRGYWSKSGRYVSLVPRLEEIEETNKLRAIYVIVMDSFENMC
jgi:hypothetical protein